MESPAVAFVMRTTVDVERERLGIHRSEPVPHRGFMDSWPVFGHAKMACQLLIGDTESAKRTWFWNSIYGLGTSQICSAYDCCRGDAALAIDRQCRFLHGASDKLQA